ncbi:hypothetical protein ACHAXR_005454, partial [Thalassiosira sp. AJA248-18]
MSTAAENIGNHTLSTKMTGDPGCQCIDASATLASLAERSCTTSDGQNGVLLTVSGPCVSYNYGSSVCLPHDIDVDPLCLTQDSAADAAIPGYCTRSFCYVDAMQCMGASSQRVFRSGYFPIGLGVDLFFSYSTCGSSAEDWFESQQTNPMGGQSLTAITAAYNILPFVFKRDYNGDIPMAPGEEYYNNSVPYEGVHINYAKSLEAAAEGDFTLKFIHGSRASKVVHPSSPGNAAVQDVADGLVDIAIGPIWITVGRLQAVSFTMPIQQDKTVLVIPQPGIKSSLSAQTQKVLDPFTWGVWGLLIGSITVTALLSVWFSGKFERHRKPQQGQSHTRKRKIVYARLAIDEILQKGMFFCSAGVEQDAGASLPHKLLMFGFAFLILIVVSRVFNLVLPPAFFIQAHAITDLFSLKVSAYVANLAAFLTRNDLNVVSTIEDVVAQGSKICAHPALQDDLERQHPGAKFVFNQEGKELFGLVEDYDAGKCDVLAVGKMDSLGDLNLMDQFCERHLVYTESLIIENAVGFPIRPELASGFSYWMYHAEEYHGVSPQVSREEYDAENNLSPKCNVMLSEQDGEASDYTKISVENLIFPIMFYLGFAVLAVILQLYYRWVMKSGNENLRRSTLVGRASTLNLFAGTERFEKKDDDEYYEEEDDVEEDVLDRSRALDRRFGSTEGRDVQSPRSENTGASIAKGTMMSDT